MTPERWAQIEHLFHRAAECGPDHRTALLDQACSDDPELRRQVEVLLSSDGSAADAMQAAVRSELEDIGFPLTGEVVSHYRILDGAGGGGMGLVYRAEDIKLGRLVAIKFLPEESANNPFALSRFEREARSASALEHPNICPIYEFGEHEGKPFLVMQLLEGQTLRELLEGEKSEDSDSDRASEGKPLLSLDRVLDLAIQIASGLEAAHRKGIIHRDIKPGNIFVTREGQVKILDFGLAKLAHEVGAAVDARDSSHLAGAAYDSRATLNPFVSRTGVAIGTAAYMSPEQVRGESLDARTDLFSFGLVLYEMATGQRAFSGETGPQLHKAILTETPRQIRQINRRIPAKLERIIHKAIAKDREARYQNVSEMHADLERLKRETGTKRLPRWILPSATAVLLVLTGALFWVNRHRPSASQALPDIKFRQLTINSADNPVTSGSISHDGKYLAYVDPVGIHVRNLQTGITQAVSPPDSLRNDELNWEIVSAGWLPDNSRFVTNAHPRNEEQDAWSSRTTSIWVFSRLGEAPRQVRDRANAWSVSPDGSFISFGTNIGKLGEREIWLIRPDGSDARKLFDADENSAVVGTFWSPDGRRALIVHSDASGDTIQSRDFHGGSPVTVFAPAESKQLRGDGAWLPDGRLVYQVAEPVSGGGSPQDTCNFWAIKLDPTTGAAIEKPKRLTSWTGFCISSANATADGKRLAFLASSNSHGTVYTADLKAGGTRLLNQRHFTMDEGDDYVTDWIDSETLLVDRNAGDHYELYRQPLNGDIPEHIVTAPPGGALEGAVVSPDGKWVLVQVWPIPDNPTQVVPIVRISSTGGAPEEIFRVQEGSLISCAKTPSTLCTVAESSDDKKQMIITSFDAIKGRGAELARFDIDPKMDVSYYLQGRISPDGTRLLALTNSNGPIEILSLRGGQTKVVHPKGADHILIVGWTADGKGLYVTNRTKEGSDLLYVDLQGNTRLLRSCTGGSLRQGCWGVPSPDGRHFAIDDLQRGANVWAMENF